LDAAQKPLSLEELGMLPDTVDIVREGISKSYGMVLITGPTGSGKTTTLYSLMSILNKPEVNIVTIEDPIEYDMRYVNQVQVNQNAGVTFASGLRSILRQDPNIIMVGEIRDSETASISVQSALTGHVVLSSLHTNDAPTAVPRLMDMGVKRFLVSAVINVISAQRLVRNVHLECIESYEPDETIYSTINEQLKNIGVDPSTIKLPKTFYKGKGCDNCNDTGYSGRGGIFEVMNVTEKIRDFVASPDFDLEKLRVLAREEGMISMFEDGLKKVERGMTTIDEILRVIRE
ncbi:MAG: GspE/PulE family protein, partial [Candidatus Paceibacterota bacterium]